MLLRSIRLIILPLSAVARCYPKLSVNTRILTEARVIWILLTARNYSMLFNVPLILLFDTIFIKNSYHRNNCRIRLIFSFYKILSNFKHNRIKFWKIHIIIKSSLCPRYITQNCVIRAESKVLMMVSEYCHETSHTKLRRAWMRQEKWSCRSYMRSSVTLPRNFRGKCAIRKFNDNYNLHETDSHTILFKRIVNIIKRIVSTEEIACTYIRTYTVVQKF